MIKKIIIYTLLLLVSYHVFLSIFPLESYIRAPANYLHVEQSIDEFVFEDELNKKNIVIGSSMAERLQSDILTDFHILSFSNSNSNGIIPLLNHLDKVKGYKVYIEVNGIYAKDKYKLKDTYFFPGKFLLKKISPIFHQKNNPIRYLANLLSMLRDKLFLSNTPSAISQESTTDQADPHKDKLRENILSHFDSFEEIDSITLINNLNNLLSETKILQEHNEVIFLELPMDPAIMNSKTMDFILRSAKRLAHENGIEYLNFPNNYRAKDFKDAVHFNMGPAKEISYWLEKK